jgi:hypothetical protein
MAHKLRYWRIELKPMSQLRLSQRRVVCRAALRIHEPIQRCERYLFEWHRGASNPFIQLNPVGLTSQSFTVTADGAMIVWLANDAVVAPALKAYLIDRSLPGQAWLLSSAAATLGISSGVSLIIHP